jgi:hypothetical protein
VPLGPRPYPVAMAQNPAVIYLPPGVVAQPVVGSPPSAPTSNIPFDRNFFEKVLPAAIESFCKQTDCKTPMVELLTVDGATHFVNGISGVSEAWVALHASRKEHEHPMQVFVPFQTIFRVEIHPEPDSRNSRLGFITSDD